MGEYPLVNLGSKSYSKNDSRNMCFYLIFFRIFLAKLLVRIYSGMCDMMVNIYLLVLDKQYTQRSKESPPIFSFSKIKLDDFIVNKFHF